MKKRKYFCILAIPIIIGVLSLVIMLLWNAILPDLLGVNSISFWQALGVLILSKILFGGFGYGGRKRFGPPRHVRRRWKNMNEEERQKFKEEWKTRCQWRK